MKISITGTVKEGKSTIVRYLEKCLADIGIATEVEDEALAPEWGLHQDKRLIALKEQGLVVKLKTFNKMNIDVG
jgi:hypothetical protein